MIQYVVTDHSDLLDSFTIFSAHATLDEAKKAVQERTEIGFIGLDLRGRNRRLEPLISRKFFIRKVKVEVVQESGW